MTETNNGNWRDRKGRVRKQAYGRWQKKNTEGIEREIAETLRASMGQIDTIAKENGLKGGAIVRFLMAFITTWLPQVIVKAITEALGTANATKDFMREVFDLKGGGELTVLTGNARMILAKIKELPDARAIIFAGVDTYARTSQVIIGYVAGINADQGRIEVPKVLVNRFLANPGWSWIGAMKAFKGTDGTVKRMVVYGQNLDMKTVQTFAQGLADATYDGNKLRGGRVAQTVFVTPASDGFAFATWLVNAPDRFMWFNPLFAGARYAFVGSYGIVVAKPNGNICAARLEDILDGRQETWKQIATLPFGGIEDLSVAFKTGKRQGGSTTYTIVATASNHTFVTMKVTATPDAITATIDSGVQTMQNYLGAPLGTFHDMAVVKDGNGAPVSLAFIPQKDTGHYGLPAAMIPIGSETGPTATA